MGQCGAVPTHGPPLEEPPPTDKTEDNGKDTSYVPLDKSGKRQEQQYDAQDEDDAEVEFDSSFAENMTVHSDGDWVLGRKLPKMFRNPVTLEANVERGGTKLKAHYGFHTERGENSKGKPNQDSYVVCRNLGTAGEANPLCDGLAVWGVFDGHGPKGEQASTYCRMKFAEIFNSSVTKTRSVEEGYRSMFEDTHAALQLDLGRIGDPQLSKHFQVSGSTAVTALLDGDQLHVANVGDSRAVLGSRTDGPRGKAVASNLSWDHKPSDSRERDRHNKAGALLKSEVDIRGHGDANKIYICRQSDMGIRYGILFSRSVGDYDAHQHLGVISEPTMEQYTVKEGDFIILATDGVWDAVTTEEAVEIIDRYPASHAQEATAALVNETRSRWKEVSPKRWDDITVVVVFFTNIEKAAEPEAEAEAEAKTEAAAEAKTEAEPVAEAAPKPEAEAEPAAKPEAAAEPEAEPAAEAKTEAEPAAEAEAKTEAKPVAEAAAEPEAEPAPKPEAEAKTEAEAAPKPEAEAAPKPEAEAKTEAEAAPKPEAEAKTEADPEPKTEAEPEAAGATEAAPPKPEAGAEAKTEAGAAPASTTDSSTS